jgi:hypothetical protein
MLNISQLSMQLSVFDGVRLVRGELFRATRSILLHTGSSRPSQLPVLDPVRLVGCGPQAGPFVSLILGVVSIKPDDIAVALEGDYVCRDPVEKPPVVTYHYGAPSEILESVFQRAHGVNVEVICRLVEQNHIGALF